MNTDLVFYILISIIFACFVLWMMWSMYRGTRNVVLPNTPLVNEDLTEDQKSLLTEYCNSKKKSQSKKRKVSR